MSQHPYLLKISNDIDEGLWDLLLVHTWEEPKSIARDSPYAKDFVVLLKRAIAKLEAESDRIRTKPDFRVQFLRTKLRSTLILANKVLRYQPADEDIKQLKRRIIEEYTGSPPDESEMIPLRYQISELRITYDPRYLEFLIEAFLKKEDYDKALYCLLTYGLLEPDHPKLEPWRVRIRSWASEPELPSYEPAEPEGLVLLDANALFPLVFIDTAGYRFSLSAPPTVSSYAITPSVMAELRAAWVYHLENAHKLGIDTEELKAANEPRIAACEEKLIDVEADEKTLESIRALYSKYLFTLEKILYRKLAHEKRLSDKLAKLSHRDTLLPEDGDLRLLAEAVALKERNVAIMSNDADFLRFQGVIREQFGIEILKV